MYDNKLEKDRYNVFISFVITKEKSGIFILEHFIIILFRRDFDKK